MAETSIEWAEHVWNPVRGCTKVSPGCSRCYAATFAERWRGVPGHAYEQGFDLRLVPDKLDEPLRRKKPTTYFVNSMSDLFQEDVPATYVAEVFGIMAQARQHTFQVLTKRADRMRELLSDPPSGVAWPLPNVWLGVSVENQHFADERIPLLLETPAAVRFISAEPLLGPVDLRRYFGEMVHFKSHPQGPDECELRWLNWVIVGGESGHGARPFDVAWARSIVKQCKAAGVPVFVKQLGADVRDRNDAGFEGDTPTSWPMDTDVQDHPNGFRDEYQGALVRVRLAKKGGDPAQWPADLRVREMPRTG